MLDLRRMWRWDDMQGKTGGTMVEMRNIHKWFGRVCALRGVDFRVGYSEVVGLVGDNGAGKSTLIKVLSGVFPPDEGEIVLEGRVVRFSSPRDAMEAGIETIHQETALVDTMDVRRNIFLGRELTYHLGPIELLDLKRMAEESARALREVGLELRSAAASVRELSGGQRQGVAIARAMYFKTRLLILDEPTNNLSVKESNKVLQYIRDLKRQGISSIFITHNLHHVYPAADRLVVLKHGEKIADVDREDTSIEELTHLMIA